MAFNKSGISSKFGLIVGACCVDYLYTGEIHLNIINTSREPVTIYEDMKILQFIEIPIFNSDINIVENINPEEFYEGMQTDRGTAGFGSSDKN
jgi:dUTPase